MHAQPELEPLPLRKSWKYFFGPALLGVFGVYILFPVLNRAGVPLLANYLLTVVSMFPFLLGLALIAYRRENRPWSWRSIRERFRLYPLNGRGWLWTAGLLVVYIGGQLILLPTAGWLANTLPLPVPPVLPPALSLSFVVSHQKNSTPGVIAHLALNGLGFLMILFAILGVGT